MKSDMKYKTRNGKRDNKYQNALEMIQNKISELVKQQDNLCDLLEKEVYSPDLFNRRNAVIESELTQLKLDEADLLSKVEDQSKKETQAVNFIPTAQRLLDNYVKLSVKEKNMLWKEVLEKVTVFRSQADEVSITIFPRLPQ